MADLGSHCTGSWMATAGSSPVSRSKSPSSSRRAPLAEGLDDSPAGPTLGVLAESFRRARPAENKSPKTVMTYLDAVTTLEAYLRAKRLPIAVEHRRATRRAEMAACGGAGPTPLAGLASVRGCELTPCVD